MPSETVVLSGVVFRVSGDSVTIDVQILSDNRKLLRGYGNIIAGQGRARIMNDGSCDPSFCSGIEVSGEVRAVTATSFTLRLLFLIADSVRGQIEEGYSGDFIVTDDGKVIGWRNLQGLGRNFQDLVPSEKVDLGDGEG